MTPERAEQVGQYVLGLLDGAEREAFEAEMSRDAELRVAVNRLSEHLQQLDDTATPVAPNADLWDRIEGALEHQRPPAHEKSATVHPWRLKKRSWQPFAIAASLVLAVGAGYVAGDLRSAGNQPVVIAVLLNESDAAPGAIVEAFADDSVRLVPLEEFDVPAGRILQVWTLPDPDTGPVSLGTFDDPTSIRLTGPDLPEPQTGQLYEITLEPSPGSPTGRPTGPIVVKGYAKAPV
jgi:anti-sigma-K factor RskA